MNAAFLAVAGALVWAQPGASPPARTPLLFLGNEKIPPVVYLEGGVATGVAVDLVRAIAPHLSRPVEVRAMDWATAQALVSAGEADALVQINPSPERLRLYDFSEPLLESRFSIFARTDTMGITDAASLRGLRVGVEAAGLPRQVLSRDPGVRLEIIPDFLTGFARLGARDLDAVVVDYRVGSYVLARNGIRNLAVVGEPVAFSRSAIAVRKGNAALLQDIDAALRRIREDGTYDRVLARWEPKEVVFWTREQLTRTVALAAVAALVVVVLLSASWLATLRRQLTRRRAAEAELARRNALLAGVIGSTNAIIFSIDRAYRYTSFNARHAEVMRALYGAEVAAGESLLELMASPEDREKARRNLDRALAGEHVLEEEWSGAPGRARRCYVVAHSPVRATGGEVIGAVMLAQDVTDAKAQEEARRRSDEQYRQIVETAQEGIWVVDAERRTTFVNGQLARMLRCPVEALAGAPLTDFVDAADLGIGGLGPDPLRTATGQLELRLLRADGTELWGLFGTTPLHDAQGRYTGALVMVTDVTDRRAMEAQLRQAQKLEAVGRLAGGVAHDFNNLLTAILGNAQVLSDELDPAHPLRVEAAEIEATARRAALLTRQLLAFGRKQAMEPRVVDVGETLDAMTNMLRRLIGEDVVLTTTLPPGLGRIRVDPVQLEQVILNLAVNARDAMPGGGRLEIAAANVERPAAGADPRLDAGGPYVRITVSDTGSGMSPDVQAHLFEPFFTTKGPGKGTGLGLATVYGIVRQAGGDVRVRSAPGEGTTFEVSFPRLDAPVEAPELATPRQAPRGKETVLVVEDEPMVRALAVRVLRGAGYQVLDAPDAQEALRLVSGLHGHPLDLLLTDVVMPHLGGPDLADRLRAGRPRLPVLFASGYMDRMVDVHERLDRRTAFLAKPFTPGELACKVRELLDRAEEPGKVAGR